MPLVADIQLQSDRTLTREVATQGRPPRAMAWVLLLTAAVAILLVGLAATTVVFRNLEGSILRIPGAFWGWFGLACLFTVASLSLRILRWMFLLRRSEARIPLRDAYIGYLSGLSLLLAPFLLGEIAVRALVHRARARIPIETTVIVNLWERLLDLIALVTIAAVLRLATQGPDAWTWTWALLGGATALAPVRRACLAGIEFVSRVGTRRFATEHRPRTSKLVEGRSWSVALATSIVAWILPGLGFWTLVRVWDPGTQIGWGIGTYAESTALGAFELAPGGVLVAGGHLLAALEGRNLSPAAAAVSVIAIRLATLGLATVLGALFVVMHLSTRAAEDASHFDAIAQAYDVQIPESRRAALLTTKTEMMRTVLEQRGIGRRGLDVGCGQGAYVARMQALGFDVFGIDDSGGQIERARANVRRAESVAVGSILDIPMSDSSCDFAYVINVLHHLPSVADQRQAFAELFRVLRPGGLLFVHEINTRNILFRFYMGYVFPALNCIDEGVERWLLPHQLQLYTKQSVVETRYFTFLPDFVPRVIASAIGPIERLLEESPLAVYSAHYMAVLRKDLST